MKVRLSKLVGSKGWEEKTGELPNGNQGTLELDWAIVDHESRTALITDMKWFIEPAEIREAIEKGQELGKGVKQALKRADVVLASDQARKWVDVGADYTIFAAVIYANWIGNSDVQNPDCPIIYLHHLINRIEKCNSLCEVCSWLNHREYLPVENEHFAIESFNFSAGGWSANWYGIKALKNRYST